MARRGGAEGETGKRQKEDLENLNKWRELGAALYSNKKETHKKESMMQTIKEDVAVIREEVMERTKCHEAKKQELEQDELKLKAEKQELKKDELALLAQKAKNQKLEQSGVELKDSLMQDMQDRVQLKEQKKELEQAMR